MDAQNLWAVYNLSPVLALDVCEHAYARDGDWDHVDRQLAQAGAAKSGADATGLRENAPVAGQAAATARS